MRFTRLKKVAVTAWLFTAGAVLGAPGSAMAEALQRGSQAGGPARMELLEREGNLELHFRPALSLAGLSVSRVNSLSDREKTVLLIAYRLKDNPGQRIVQRAVLTGFRLYDGFAAFRDPDDTEYDRIVVSNREVSRGFKPMDLEAAGELMASSEVQVSASEATVLSSSKSGAVSETQRARDSRGGSRLMDR